MTRQQFSILVTVVVFVTLAALSTTAADPKGGDYWVFVTAYGLTAVFAACNRFWIGALAALAVAVVRAMVALHITGVPFEVASSAFAALLLLVVQDDVNKRRDAA